MKSVIVFATAVLFALPGLAHAQDSGFYTEGERWVLNELQLVESLQSPIDGVRTQALRNAIIFATLYRDHTSLDGALDALRLVYEADVRPENRKLALAALQSLAHESTRRYLARRVTVEESDEGRALVATVLNDYYSARAAATRAEAGL